MGRLANSTLFLIVVILLFHFAGLLEGSPSGLGYILDKLGVTNPENMFSSTFWIGISAISGIIVAGIVIGTILTRSFDLAFFAGATVPLLLVMVLIAEDLILIFNVLRLINNALAVILISPLIWFYGMSIHDWVRGRDT